jgi:hypothetical protein
MDNFELTEWLPDTLMQPSCVIKVENASEIGRF